MMPVIEFKNVSKSFVFDPNEAASLKKLMIRLFKRDKGFNEDVKVEVLDNISFRIFEGESVAIMGKNGVGKSTILKLLTGIYHPTGGEIFCSGRIAPLLELGAGFRDELSGYDNIFLNSAILGFSKEEVYEHLDEIIEFSELGPKIHMSVKNYSSGMLMRLGFSVAAFLSAPILLFDEILAVGDVSFQRKCERKIEDLRKQGRTIILISHNPEAVKENCDRCIVLDKQEVLYDGEVIRGADLYQEILDQAERDKPKVEAKVF